jgi:hypothetical protein
MTLTGTPEQVVSDLERFAEEVLPAAREIEARPFA